MLDFQAARWTVDQEVAPQTGNNHPTVSRREFRTTDGHINITSAGKRSTASRPLMQNVTKPDYADGEARSKNRDALNAEINAIIKTKDRRPGWTF